MKTTRKTAIFSFLMVVCILLNICPTPSNIISTAAAEIPTAQSAESGAGNRIVYSSDNGFGFGESSPSFKENGGSGEIRINRSGEVSSSNTVKLKVYDNSAEYGKDYLLEYGGNEVAKKEDSGSIYNAFRENGVLSSNLPIDSAELFVSYSESSKEEGNASVNSSEMLAQMEELNALVAEIEVSFKEGTATETLTVKLLNDSESEYNESFILVLVGKDGNIIENSQILCSIEDDEEAPSVHVEFTSEAELDADSESGIAEIEFMRSGNLATGTSALLLQDETPIGYVDFSPYQEKQVVLALPGTYRLFSQGEYTVGDSTVTVKGEAKSIKLPEGADPELDSVPPEYSALPYTVQGAPSPDKFAEWARNGASETDEYIIVMGDSNNQLFTKDPSSTDGSLNYLGASNMYRLDTEGGAKKGYLFSRTVKKYDLSGIESVEGTVYVDDLTTGCCDVIFGVWNTEHKKIYTDDNKSTQNLKQDVKVGWGEKYIYYCNSDLDGVWNCGYNAYTPNGFKMNKRKYDIFIMNPEALDYCGVTVAPTIVTGSNKMTYTMGNNKNIAIAYTCSDTYPARLTGFKLFNGNTMNYSGFISLSGSNIVFDQKFLKAYDSAWGYNVTDESNNTRRTISILPVFEKIPVDMTIKESALGSLTLKSPAETPCKGDTLVFEGVSKDTAFPFTGVFYQCRQSEGGEVLAHGVVLKVGDTVTFPLNQNYNHYTFQGVFNSSADRLSVMYAEENPNGKLEASGIVLSGSDYRLSDYYPLMAEPNQGYITLWENSQNFYFGDIYNYQLDGNYLHHDVAVRFVKPGDLLDPSDSNSVIVLETADISGRITRKDWNLFDDTCTEIPLGKTMYTVTTSHGNYCGYTDENGYYTIKDFTAVKGGTYSMAVNYQERVGFMDFVFDGEDGDYDISLPQFAVGGFYPVEVTATVSGVGYGSNTLSLTSAGTVQIASKIYLQTNDYKITKVEYSFCSTLSSNYGDELASMSAKFNENANVGDNYQLWTLDLSETTAVPINTAIYVTVTAEYTNDAGATVKSTIDPVNSGYNVVEALNEQTVPIQQDIPYIPGIQDTSSGHEVNEIPIIGALHMSVSSRTGGYFIQTGSWSKPGDTYTLVCGHSIQPHYLSGTLESKHEAAKKTSQTLKDVRNKEPQGKANLKQLASANMEIEPIFMLKFTIETRDDGEGGTDHHLIGFELALGIDTYINKNIPFSIYGVPCYFCISLQSEAFLQLQTTFPEGVRLGDPIDRVVSDMINEGIADIDAFVAAPILNFGLKGGVGYNGWLSVFGEGHINAPFVLCFSPIGAAGALEAEIAVGADLALFTAKFEADIDIVEYGDKALLEDLKTIQGNQNLSTFTLSSGESYDNFEDAVNNMTFSVIPRPKSDNSILHAGPINQTVLAEGVFKNTKIQLVNLKNGNIMALFLTDNRAPDGSLNYLSAAYSISKDNGKTWSSVECISENTNAENSSLQFDINVFELDDRILVTWSEADLDSMIQDMDVNNLSAAEIAKLISAMNLCGRFFDNEGSAISDAFVIAENSTVFCGALDAVRNDDKVYVYYQRNALVADENTTIESLISSERTIALACLDINAPDASRSVPVRAVTEEGSQYRIVEVVPFVHKGVMGEIMVIDRNGKLLIPDYESGEMVADAEDRQLFLRTYSFDENGVPYVTSFMPITDDYDCNQSPQVVTNGEDMYLFWNRNGEIVYTSDLVARETDSEAVRNSAFVLIDSQGDYTVASPKENGFSSIDGDESFHVGSKFTVSMSEEGKVFICWVGTDYEDTSIIPTDEIYGVMLEKRLVSEVMSMTENGSNTVESKSADKDAPDGEHQLWAVGSPVALTDEDRPIGALDSICFENGKESKYLLAYTRFNNLLRNESTSADIMALRSVDRPELSAEIAFPKYPTPDSEETALVTLHNSGFHTLNGFTMTVSGVGKTQTATVDKPLLPGRTVEIELKLKVPADFASDEALKLSVSGLGEQSVYKAEAETEVLYGSYFITTDIPSVSPIANSDDCNVTVYLKNIGNAEGCPELEFQNKIFASSEAKDLLTYAFDGDTSVSPDGEAKISFTLKDTLINRDSYSTLRVSLGEGYDQATEAPMPKPVSRSIEDVLHEKDETEPDSSDPDNSESDDSSATPPAGDKGTVNAYVLLVVASLALVYALTSRKKSAKWAE
ncbi:MAG: hypothetical protein IKM53_02965 [Clostridia bacterium]|nr:hypothetical protein [Clostridia bacterium]